MNIFVFTVKEEGKTRIYRGTNKSVKIIKQEFLLLLATYTLVEILDYPIFSRIKV
jgi:hypothetical protein